MYNMNDGYYMIPVCHEKKDITIETNGLVYASFTNARPDVNSEFKNKDTNGTFTIANPQV